MNTLRCSAIGQLVAMQGSPKAKNSTIERKNHGVFVMKALSLKFRCLNLTDCNSLSASKIDR